MNKYIRDPRDGDLEYLAEHLRELDKEEALANDGRDLLSVLKESAELSYHVQIIDISGKPAAIFGICTFYKDTDAIWMLGTDEMSENPIAFARYSRPMITELFLKSGATRFQNFAYAKNTVHLRWLEWCHAHISPEPTLVGIEQKEFRLFTINRNDYV